MIKIIIIIIIISQSVYCGHLTAVVVDTSLIPLRSFASCWLDGHLASGWRYASGHARKASSKSSKEQTKETDKKVQSAVSKAREGLLGKAYKVLSSSEIAPNTPETWNLLHQKHPRGPVPSHPEVTLPSEGFKLPPDFDIMSVLRQFPKDSACGPSGRRKLKQLKSIFRSPSVLLSGPLLTS